MRATLAPALRERLGEKAALGLTTFVDDTAREWKGELMEAITERFGRMLAEETGKLRTAMAEHAAHVDARFAEQAARLDARLAEQRAELLKWSFLFWIGQVAAMAALLAFMLRGLHA